MPKRRNPFDDSLCLQKMHIGQKEVNLGVNNVENMKKVYENTLKMLYNGSMKNQTRMLKVQTGIPVPTIQNGVSAVHNGASASYNGLSAFQNGTSAVHNGASVSYNGQSAFQNGTSAVHNRLSNYQNGPSSSTHNGLSGYQNETPAFHNGTSANQNGLSTFSNGISSVPSVSTDCQGYFNNKIGDKKSGKVVMINPCCRSNLQIICSFCERIMCATCSRICESCSFKFCYLCSVLKYDLEEETAVCLSCM